MSAAVAVEVIESRSSLVRAQGGAGSLAPRGRHVVVGLGCPAAPVGRGHLRLVPGGLVETASPANDLVASPVRLTRFGRLVFVGLVVALVALVGSIALVLSLVSTPSGPSAVTPTHSITVADGETLSQIAARELPQLTIAQGVARIQTANTLPSTEVAAGQRLEIPAPR